MPQLPLFDGSDHLTQPATGGFGGSTVAPSDVPRLSTQLAAVQSILSDGQWHTIDELAAAVEYLLKRRATTQSISARLRDLKKPQFGSHDVVGERISGGLWHYRMSK